MCSQVLGVKICVVVRDCAAQEPAEMQIQIVWTRFIENILRASPTASECAISKEDDLLKKWLIMPQKNSVENLLVSELKMDPFQLKLIPIQIILHVKLF